MLPKITKHSKLSSLTLKFSITKVAALIAMQAGHCQQLLACHTSQSCARVLPKELGYWFCTQNHWLPSRLESRVALRSDGQMTSRGWWPAGAGSNLNSEAWPATFKGCISSKFESKPTKETVWSWRSSTHCWRCQNWDISVSFQCWSLRQLLVVFSNLTFLYPLPTRLYSLKFIAEGEQVSTWCCSTTPLQLPQVLLHFHFIWPWIKLISSSKFILNLPWVLINLYKKGP